jgi:hypothetical protein
MCFPLDASASCGGPCLSHQSNGPVFLTKVHASVLKYLLLMKANFLKCYKRYNCVSLINDIKKVNAAVMPWTRILDVLGSNLDLGTNYSDWDYPSFSRLPQTSTGTVPSLHHDRFLPYPFQFIIHLSSSHLTLYDLDTDKVIEELYYKPEGRGLDSRWGRWIFK